MRLNLVTIWLFDIDYLYMEISIGIRAKIIQERLLEISKFLKFSWIVDCVHIFVRIWRFLIEFVVGSTRDCSKSCSVVFDWRLESIWIGVLEKFGFSKFFDKFSVESTIWISRSNLIIQTVLNLFGYWFRAIWYKILKIWCWLGLKSRFERIFLQIFIYVGCYDVLSIQSCRMKPIFILVGY